MYCHRCGESLPVPNTGAHVTITLTHSTYGYSHRIGDVVFHASCFFEVAGEEYKEALTLELSAKNSRSSHSESTGRGKP